MQKTLAIVALALAALAAAAPAHAAPKPWVIVPCKFSGDSSEPRTQAQFRQLFTEAGAGTGGLYDFYLDQSYGLHDLTGTVVTQWYQLSYTKADALQKSRFARWRDCIQAADPDVHFPDFAGIVAVYNDCIDGWGSRYTLTLDGVTKQYGATLLDKCGLEPSYVAQEMTHGLGILDHSWSANPDFEYGDDFDVMSSLTSGWRFNGTYGRSGPGFTALFRTRLGWLPYARRYAWSRNCGNGTCPVTITLAALSRPQAFGYLVAEVPTANGRYYTVELRLKEGWDAGIPRPAIVIHEIRNGVPYLWPARAAHFVTGQTYFDRTNRLRITVVSINPTAGTATVTIAGDLVAPKPGALTFPSQPRNSTSPAKLLGIVNNEAGNVTITSVSVTGPYAASKCGPGTVVPAGGTCSLDVTYSPTTNGSHGGQVTIAHSGASVPITVDLEGWSIGPKVTLNLSSLSFAWKPGSTLTKTLVVWNDGADTLSIPSIVVGDRSGDPGDWYSVWDFDLDPASSCLTTPTVGVGKSCVLKVGFRSLKAGSFNATLFIATDATTGTAKVPLAATAVEPAASLAPAMLDFGSVSIGGAATLSATLANSGSVPLDVKSVQAGGNFSLASPAPCPAQLAPGAACAIAVTFTPTGNGPIAGSLWVTTDAPASPHVASLVGYGPPLLSAAPSDVDFGAVAVGSQSAGTTVTLSNMHPQGDRIAVIGVHIAGQDAGQFDLLRPQSGDDCRVQTALEAPDVTCTVPVVYRPQSLGVFHADLVFETNAGPNGLVIVPLVGRPALVATSAALELGKVLVGEESEVVTVAIQSDAEGKAELTEIVLDGPDAADFRLVPVKDDCGSVTTLVQGVPCSVGIALRPSAAGRRSASLHVVTALGRLEIAVAGDGA